MNILNKIRRKLIYWSDLNYIKQDTARTKKMLESVDNTKPVVYYMCTPIHPNLGDQAQMVCIQKWLSENYPNYQIVECCARTMPTNWLDIMKKNVKNTDVILVHSGYLFMNLSTDVPMILDLVQNFLENKIILFPQTVNFPDKKVEAKFEQGFAKHNDITLLCRDFVSYEKATAIFKNNKCIAFPDIVTSLIGTYKSNTLRKGVCLCLRNDKEKFYSDIELSSLANKLKPYGISRTDTTLKITSSNMNKNREYHIWRMVKKLSTAKVVITDRYHGTIFSVIANTPIIVINSTDHKLSSGVKWFPQDIFGKAIQYADSLDTAYLMAKDILDNPNFTLSNPPYFKYEYWSKLNEQI